jgi:hypothetical protein
MGFIQPHLTAYRLHAISAYANYVNWSDVCCPTTIKLFWISQAVLWKIMRLTYLAYSNILYDYNLFGGIFHGLQANAQSSQNGISNEGQSGQKGTRNT